MLFKGVSLKFLEKFFFLKKKSLYYKKVSGFLNLRYIGKSYLILDYLKNVFMFKTLVKILFLFSLQTQRMLFVSTLFLNFSFCFFFRRRIKFRRLKKMFAIALCDPLFFYISYYSYLNDRIVVNYNLFSQFFLWNLLRLISLQYELQKNAKCCNLFLSKGKLRESNFFVN